MNDESLSSEHVQMGEGEEQPEEHTTWLQFHPLISLILLCLSPTICISSVAVSLVLLLCLSRCVTAVSLVILRLTRCCVSTAVVPLTNCTRCCLTASSHSDTAQSGT